MSTAQRPTTVRCADCGLPVAVGPLGPVPERCERCRRDYRNLVARERHAQRPPEPLPSVPCGCGCGEMVERAPGSGRPRRYVDGKHLMREKNRRRPGPR